MHTLIECDFEDRAWTGPFADRPAAMASIDNAIKAAGLRRDDDYGELVLIRLIRVNDTWWAWLPAILARGDEMFLICLEYDPENEWGAPIGYNVTTVVHHKGQPHFGKTLREVREDTHPDEGEYQGGIAELCRRSGVTKIQEEDFDEIGIFFNTT